ncbi:DHRS11.2 family protein [Megaselia abdita]
MDRFCNKIAVVTGASSGIGAACAVELVKSGMVVKALARTVHKLEEVKASLPEDLRQNFHPVYCDVSKEDQVIKTFDDINNEHGGVHVLVNNAGIYKPEFFLISKGNTDDIKDTVNTNIMGVVYCTREAFHSMKDRGIEGHVVNINSISGHRVYYLPGFTMNIYPPTKHAITAMTETYRQEFSNANTNIKVTSISPGLTDTEAITKDFRSLPILKPEDVANAVMYCVSTPPHVQIHELVIQPIGQKY